MSQTIKSSKDLVRGKYYKVTSENNKYVFHHKEDNDISCMKIPYINVVDRSYSSGTNGNLDTISNSSMRYYEEATFDEIEHFRQCLEAKKFVTYKPVTLNNQSYEIF